MKKSLARLFVFLAVSVMFASAAYAEHLFGPDELDTTYGVVFRLRQEIWERAFDLNTLTTPPLSLGTTQNRNFFRLKTSAFTKFDYDKKYALFLKLTNEMQYYLDVSKYPSELPPPASHSQFAEDELVFDNLYVDLNLSKALNIPVDFRIGRQDFIMTHGEGFLLMDGTPGDGSRTFYFNAAKANIRFNENYNLDLIYITNPDKDNYLPSLYTPPGKRRLTTSDEYGFVAYGRGKVTPDLTLEPYYMWKQEDAWRNSRGVEIPELDINTVGLRAVFKHSGWTARGEFAYQWGEYDNNRDREAFGGFAFIGRKYENTTWKPEFDLGFVYLSGDDPDTAGKDEGWDPLFSQWPMWSELFVFTLVPETANKYTLLPAYWTNLMIARANVKLNFTPQTNLALWYNYLWADEKTNFGAPLSGMFSNDSKERGHLPQVQVSHKFSKNVDGYVLLEYFIPGDFYTDKADDALFFRWQLQVKI